MQTPEPPAPGARTRPQHGGRGGPGDTRHGEVGGEGDPARRGPWGPAAGRGGAGLSGTGGEACSSESPSPPFGRRRKTWAPRPGQGRGEGAAAPCMRPGREAPPPCARGHLSPVGNGSISYKVDKRGAEVGRELFLPSSPPLSPAPVVGSRPSPSARRGRAAPPPVRADGPARRPRRARAGGRSGSGLFHPAAVACVDAGQCAEQGGPLSRAPRPQTARSRPHLQPHTSRSRSAPKRRRPGSSRRSGLPAAASGEGAPASPGLQLQLNESWGAASPPSRG